MKTNIVFFLIDGLRFDQIYGEFKESFTPNIDSLASTGLKMMDFHAAPWCAPSRRALMTGCHASRPWDN